MTMNTKLRHWTLGVVSLITSFAVIAIAGPAAYAQKSSSLEFFSLVDGGSSWSYSPISGSVGQRFSSPAIVRSSHSTEVVAQG